MTTCQDFPKLRINTDGGHDDIRAMLRDVKPDWQKEEIQIDVLSGGFSSNIFRCFPKSTPEDAVTVRVRRLLQKSNAPHANPEFEVLALKELSRAGYFPPLFATFQNGYCYQYIEGSPIVKFEVRVPAVLSTSTIRLIARELASAHSVVVPGADYTRTCYFATMAALLDNDQLTWQEGMPERKILLEEVGVIQEYACAQKSSLVLCHGDCHSGNIVGSKDLDKVTLVDWELAYVGHRACDIAHFLNVFEYVDFLQDVPCTPRPNMERLFCEYYLERVNELRNSDESDKMTADECLHQLLSEVKRFKLAVIFQWLIYVVAFWETTKKFGPDPAKIVKYNVDRYLNAKEEAFGFRRFGK